MIGEAVQCRQCGGAIAVTPGKELPECLFCGAPASDLASYTKDEAIEDPQGFIPFDVGKPRADNAFREFTNSSFWYPGDLKDASLELRKLLLPAWAWSGDIETHWAALVKANTQSGKRPVAGSDSAHFDQVLVPSSETLTLTEMARLGRFDESTMAVFDPNDSDPYEISDMTRSVARNAALAEMERRHRGDIQLRLSATTLNAHSTIEQVIGKPVLVPVWIGAYRYGDKVYHFLVNGQTGEFFGDAPKSVWKMLGVALAIVGIILAAIVCLSICTGGAAVVGG